VYPVLYVSPIGGTLIKSEANDSYNSKELTLELKVLDLTNKGFDNISDVYSDTEQILNDIITSIDQTPYFQNEFMDIVNDIEIEPLENFSDEEVSGFKSRITFRLKNPTSYCALPITPELPDFPIGSILTYNQILKILNDIQRRHLELKSFAFGKDWDFAASNTSEVYPLMYINPIKGTYFRSDEGNSYPVKSLSIELKVLDLVNLNQDNKNDVHSDTFQIITDIVNEINQHPFYNEGFLSLSGDIDLEPLEEFSDENVSGWVCTLNFRLRINTSYCALPIEEFTAEQFRQFDNSFDNSFG